MRCTLPRNHSLGRVQKLTSNQCEVLICEQIRGSKEVHYPLIQTHSKQLPQKVQLSRVNPWERGLCLNTQNPLSDKAENYHQAHLHMNTFLSLSKSFSRPAFLDLVAFNVFAPFMTFFPTSNLAMFQKVIMRTR